MRRVDLDGMLITSPKNVRYLCGFTGSNGWLLLKHRSSVFVTDSRYKEQATEELQHARIVVAGKERLSEALLRTRALGNLSVIGFEADSLAYDTVRTLRRLFKSVKLRAISNIVEPLRQIKSPSELDAIRKAIRISEKVLAEVINDLRPGVSERDVAADITWKQRRAGADGDAFPPLVLFGRRCSLVHGQPSSATLSNRQVVLIDLGCRVDGYCSDLTRMVAFGRIPAAIHEMYATLLSAQKRTREEIRAGTPTAYYDEFIRQELDQSGLSRYFAHALGHGIGLDIHETPLVSSRSNACLAAGHVITIEPGIYIPGEIGMRIEDDVLVTRDRSETLTTFPRELIAL